jgi:hypothetical protein
MPRMPHLIVISLLGMLGALGACGKSASPGGHGPPSAAPAPPSAAAEPGTSTLSEAERRFGVSPTRNKDVTYQPDVIIMEHGAEAIRSYSSNGLTWTIDANAPHAGEIQRDKILFATGRAVGRVMAVERKGNNLEVTLGPVELTDVIEEAHISWHGELDPSKMIAYYAPDYPGTYTDLDAATQESSNTALDPGAIQFAALTPGGEITGGSMRPLVWNEADRTQFRAQRVAGAGALPHSPIGALTDIAVQDYMFSPNCCGGLGVVMQYKKNGLEFMASAVVVLENPKIDFNLDILHGLKTAGVVITGVGGLRVTFDGANSGETKNVNAAIELPVDFTFPISGIGVPFSVVFHQSILITTYFTTKGAHMTAQGEYLYGGEVKAGLFNGQLLATAPAMRATKKDLAESLSGASVGVNGLVLGYGAKVLVGIGAWGLAVGPYVSVNTTVGATRGSDAQTAMVGYTCKAAQLKLWIDYGVGYAIPNTVVKALNAFLSLFHVKAISPTHGTSLGTKAIYDSSEGVPPSCKVS